MTADAPTPYTTRPAAPGDAGAILAVAVAQDVADAGRADIVLAHVEDELSDPGFEGVVVEDEAGAVVAFALLKGTDPHVAVHPGACGRGIGAFLAADVERRARAAAAPRLRQEVMSANRGAAALLQAAGYRRELTSLRMERELDGGEHTPEWPPGVEVRPFERGRDDRAAYELVSRAMADVPGSTDRSFEEWTARALGSALAPGLSAVAQDANGATVGVALCERREAGEGYVDYLAVAREARGRGLGRALLGRSLRAFSDEGMGRGALWVDSRNEPAVRLYRSAGMDVAFSADRYVKSLLRP